MIKASTMQFPSSRTNQLALAALVAFACATLGLLLLHALRTDYELRSHMISDYAVGPFGWVMVSVFMSLSAGIALLALALLRMGPSSLGRKLGLLLMAITSVGLIVSAAYRTDLPGAPDTFEGTVHAFSFLANVVSLLVAIPLLSFSFAREPALKTYRPVALVLALMVVLAFMLQFFTLRKGMPYGLTNRLFVAVLLTWFMCTANRLRKVPSVAST